MSIKSVFSSKASVDEVVNDLVEQLESFNASMILFFASPKYEPYCISKKMQESFPESTVFGCTTAGEICNGKILNESVVAMAFKGQALEDIKNRNCRKP